MKIAVLSDVHSAAGAYRAALAAARTEGFDALLILGDLLTYGVDPIETIELTQSAVEQDAAVLIAGNHDQIYFDLEKGGSTYSSVLPEWIRESVEWTQTKLGGRALSELFDWRPEWSAGTTYLSHANPNTYGDWTYLNSAEHMNTACAVLAQRSFRLGLFGHTHRFRRFTGTDASVITVGSVGQPRDTGVVISQWAMAEISKSGFTVEPRPLDYDWSNHLEAIRGSSLSRATKERLCRFYVP